MLFSLKLTQVTVKQKHQMSFMYDVLSKTSLGCGAVVVSLVDVTVLQTLTMTLKSKNFRDFKYCHPWERLSRAAILGLFSAATLVRKARYVQKCTQ